MDLTVAYKMIYLIWRSNLSYQKGCGQLKQQVSDLEDAGSIGILIWCEIEFLVHSHYFGISEVRAALATVSIERILCGVGVRSHHLSEEIDGG